MDSSEVAMMPARERKANNFPGFSPDRSQFPGEFHVSFAGERGVLNRLLYDIKGKNGAARED
jgi:hypothetical protein